MDIETPPAARIAETGPSLQPVPIRQRRGRWTLLALLLAAGWAARAQPAASLADLTLEQLSNIEVTSVSKRGQRLSEVAASVYVITAEDIRRAGATTLPEALRLAPNLFVARADAAQYAVTARSGADVLANKMLVLIDGRTIYSPLFSGVFWEAATLPLEDVERIEVLSGAGGTLYGSNAFHGVISVITRSALQTAGGMASATAGNSERVASGRWGAADAGSGWRVHAKRGLFDATRTATDAPVRDATRRGMAGFRMDRERDADVTTLLGGVHAHRIEDPAGERRYDGFHLLGRYVRAERDGGHTQLQAYFDRFERLRTTAIDDTLDTFDFEYQRLAPLAGDHLVLVGGSWRHHRDRAVNGSVQLVPARRRLTLASFFVQDEWGFHPDARLTVGLKAERNSYTGWEFLPGVRAAWTVRPQQLLWAGWSRVVRTPSRLDREVAAPPLVPSPHFVSEVAQIAEMGYRGQPLSAVTLSATLFHHRLTRLRSLEPAAGGLAFANRAEGSLSGVEGWAEFRPGDDWRLQAGLTHQRARFSTPAGAPPLPPGNDPRSRWHLNASWDIGPRVELFVGVRHVGRLPQPRVSSYTAVDARLGWQVTPQLALSLLLRNLTGSHVEWGAASGRSEFGRSALVQAVWRQ